MTERSPMYDDLVRMAEKFRALGPARQLRVSSALAAALRLAGTHVAHRGDIPTFFGIPVIEDDWLPDNVAIDSPVRPQDCTPDNVKIIVVDNIERVRAAVVALAQPGGGR